MKLVVEEVIWGKSQQEILCLVSGSAVMELIVNFDLYISEVREVAVLEEPVSQNVFFFCRKSLLNS